jgi:hypothetical protein
MFPHPDAVADLRPDAEALAAVGAPRCARPQRTAVPALSSAAMRSAQARTAVQLR